LSGFIDDQNCSGYSVEEALPLLCRCLRDGDGKLALDKWKEECWGGGTFEQLIECASYVFGNLSSEDPRTTFKKRMQKKGESAKMYGLQLQTLLRKVHPGMAMDDLYFINSLFTQFVVGLYDKEISDVVHENWKTDTTLNDLFKAIDCHNSKKSLLAGRIPHRPVSAVRVDAIQESSEEPQEDPQVENVAAASFKPKGGFNPNWKGNTGGQKPTVQFTEEEPSEAMLEKLTLRIGKKLGMEGAKEKQNKEKAKTPKTKAPRDISQDRCYRCLELGHHSATCPALYPVLQKKPGGGN
jgi:hypothetical protein